MIIVDIDWPRTIGAGGVTLAVLVAVYVADFLESEGLDEPPAGLWPLIGGVPGVVLGMLIANLFFPG
ncbi:hypothetical protein [Nocardiopsis sp. NRRL B-16309]|uniref:hypothetical protein n=1 Tax=Nocardiopsis sp. NRRL B-16309 TaxID=1519494 RepID=UPI0006AFF85B|nr:hypothetical protein [Nocardiopsis sp. NRRL B-16309]KOX11840.1 hypothetical protein ADL05_23045 [Nocardiopsis sp. NRRL B-16309]